MAVASIRAAGRYRGSQTPQAFQYGVLSRAYAKCLPYDLEHGTECLHLALTYGNTRAKMLPGPGSLWKGSIAIGANVDACITCVACVACASAAATAHALPELWWWFATVARGCEARACPPWHRHTHARVGASE